MTVWLWPLWEYYECPLVLFFPFWMWPMSDLTEMGFFSGQSVTQAFEVISFEWEDDPVGVRKIPCNGSDRTWEVRTPREIYEAKFSDRSCLTANLNPKLNPNPDLCSPPSTTISMPSPQLSSNPFGSHYDGDKIDAIALLFLSEGYL